MKTIEQICRVICIAEGVNPDGQTVGMGKLLPKGQLAPLWKAREHVAKALMAAYPLITMAEPL